MDKRFSQPRTLTAEQWAEILSPEEYRVLRTAGTEPPHSGQYVSEKTPGVYHCRACDQQLFTSEGKFDSHCGWPSFYAPVTPEAVVEKEDNSLGMRRVEILCGNCDSHLGHVFSGEGYDTPTDLRYCINSVCLRHDKDV